MEQPVVLIVEDDPIGRMVFKKLISLLGYQSYEASNGQAGLDTIAEHPEINHVFLDLNMPVLDGYGFLHYLNSGAKYKNLNVFITSVTDEGEFEENMKRNYIDSANIRGFNRKPFDMAQLVRNLESYSADRV